MLMLDIVVLVTEIIIIPSSNPFPPSCNLSTFCAFVANLFVLEKLTYCINIIVMRIVLVFGRLGVPDIGDSTL